MFCADLGSEVYGEKTLDIMQASRMHPNHPRKSKLKLSQCLVDTLL
jgi:hypothetical protein